eukprot:Tbor_TRINITY_DN5872_c0_g1::TRINITY_DN5872_c0_g1_i2::g.7246::m.7246/K03256/TRM6, GCD10; tRNA (adenine-N(1)-)-methyltransferase non-catalytic subunit
MDIFPDHICDGDTVLLSGGGIYRTMMVQPKGTTRLGRLGNAHIGSLIGKRYGDCFSFVQKTKQLEPTEDNPDLDRSEISADFDEQKDNRFLADDNSNQKLSETDVKAMREDMGVDGLIKTLVEGSSTFSTKTAFSQEKYIRKKKSKYAVLFKVERLTPDNYAEVQSPTLAVSVDTEETSKFLKLRADTLGLLLHYSNVHSDMHILMYEKTNGVLPAAVLNRLGPKGMLYTMMERTMQPTTIFCKNMHIPNFKERWKSVPWSAQFLTETCDVDEDGNDVVPKVSERKKAWIEKEKENSEFKGVSQWIRAKEARHTFLKERAPDSLIIAGCDDDVIQATIELLPFIALSGNITVFCPFLEPLTKLFQEIRSDAVCIKISETWYRQHQILPGRTHPQVNMNTAGGYILTGIKVERNDYLASRFPPKSDLTAGQKRARSEER